jgi:hypothetical protein
VADPALNIQPVVDLLVSALVAQHLPGALKSLGRHALRGVGNEIELFSL